MARSTFRSVTYDLDAAVAVARYVSRSESGVSSQQLAPALGYSGVNNGAFLTRLANARLFGLVAGSSSQVTLSDRGRRALSPDAAESSAARAEAFLAVPLFRAVFDHYADQPVPSPGELESVLRNEFGEADSKARVSAAKLLDSGRQAHLIRSKSDGSMRFTSGYAPFTDFTDDDGQASAADLQSSTGHQSGDEILRIGSLARASRRDAGEVGGPMDSTSGRDGGQDDQTTGIWLDEDGPALGRGGRARRRTAVVAAVAVCLVVVAVPVSLALTGSSTPVRHQATPKVVKGTHLGTTAGGAKVLAALSATTDSRNFNFTYNLSEQTSTTPTTTTTTEKICSPTIPALPTNSFHATSAAATSSTGENGQVVTGGGSTVVIGRAGATGGASVVPNSDQSSTSPTVCSYVAPSPQGNVPVSGSGTINVNPTAIVTSAAVGTGLNVVVRVSSTDYYEDIGGTSTGLAPPSDSADLGGSSSGPVPSPPTGNLDQGQPISQSAGLVEGTLGPREGGVAMLGLASPSGYLDLYQSEVSTAADLGPSTVGGVPVTVYQVQVTPAQEAQVVGATPEEQTTITAALALLKSQGYTGTTENISIDGEGYIRQSAGTANFSDGGKVNLSASFTNFGCAGTVLFPGQSGPSTPPANCTSPVPTTTVPTTAPTATTGPSTSTTVGATTSTTGPPSTDVPNTGTSLPPVTTLPARSPSTTTTTDSNSTTTTG
jgi:hypothetical protein